MKNTIKKALFSVYSLFVLLFDKELFVGQGCSIVLKHDVFVFVKHIYCDLFALFPELAVLFLHFLPELFVAYLFAWVKFVRQEFQIRLLLFFCFKGYAKIVFIMVMTQRTQFLVDQRRVCEVVH